MFLIRDQGAFLVSTVVLYIAWVVLMWEVVRALAGKAWMMNQVVGDAVHLRPLDMGLQALISWLEEIKKKRKLRQ